MTICINNNIRNADSTIIPVYISLSNFDEIAGIQFNLKTNPQYLNALSVLPHSNIKDDLDIIDFTTNSDSSITVIALSTQLDNFITAIHDTVLKINYTINPFAPPGIINLTLTSTVIIDKNGQKIPFRIKNGLVHDPQITIFQRTSLQVNSFGAFGSAWADYDLDGDDDMFYAGYVSTLLRNNGDGTFTDVGDESGVKAATAPSDSFNAGHSASWGDFDNDGDPDIFVLAQFGGRVLLENNGDNTFKDITSLAGLIVQSNSAFSVNWVDYNRDGNLDIYTSDGFLFENTGNKSFIDVSNETGIGSSSYQGTSWADFDNDGDLDLITHGGQYRNDEGMFVDITSSTGILSSSSFGGGLAWGDYNNDGFLDLYMTRSDLSPSSLYKNNGNGNFTDVTSSTFVEVGDAIASAWGDIDNDGDLDLFVSRPSNPDSAYILFRNNDDDTFTDISYLANITAGNSWPTPIQPGQGASFVDYNKDGDLDLYISNQSPP
ncbi:FG-GAP repeat domain-containing protein, partial [Calditrichota bacterium]